MIFQILNAIEKELNSQIKYAFGISEDVIILSNIVDQSGNKSLQQDNLIHLTLFRIEEDKTINKAGGYYGQFGRNTPVLINLYIVFAASHTGKKYADGVNMISWLLHYLITNDRFTHADLVGLPTEVEFIKFELQNLDPREVSNLWGSIGSKLLPHLCYKIGLIPFFKENGLNSKTEPIKGIGKNLERK